MKRSRYLQFLLAAVTALTLSPAFAVAPTITPIPISADEAFDAAATQTDPLTGEEAKVALVDVRSRAEYYWVGTAAKVNEIVVKGQAETIKPDDGRVRLIHEGKFLEYTVAGRYQRIQVEKVERLDSAPLAISIPYRFWDEAQYKLVKNDDFASSIDDLADADVKVLIVYCRSGSRSSQCVVTLDPNIAGKFEAIYEIDDPEGIASVTGLPGVGGFEGSGYGAAYNGYIGFPGRQTEFQEAPSASWKDSGLPIKIQSPLLVPTQP